MDLNHIDEFAALANAMPGHRFDANEQDSLTYAAAERFMHRQNGRSQNKPQQIPANFPEGAFWTHIIISAWSGNEQKNYDMILLHSGKLLEYPNNPFAEEALIFACWSAIQPTKYGWSIG